MHRMKKCCVLCVTQTLGSSLRVLSKERGWCFFLKLSQAVIWRTILLLKLCVGVRCLSSWLLLIVISGRSFALWETHCRSEQAFSSLGNQSLASWDSRSYSSLGFGAVWCKFSGDFWIQEIMNYKLCLHHKKKHPYHVEQTWLVVIKFTLILLSALTSLDWCDSSYCPVIFACWSGSALPFHDKSEIFIENLFDCISETILEAICWLFFLLLSLL